MSGACSAPISAVTIELTLRLFANPRDCRMVLPMLEVAFPLALVPEVVPVFADPLVVLVCC